MTSLGGGKNNYKNMKSLKESILTSNNSSKSQQAILDFLNSRFCDFDNDYNSYKYTVGKDSKGWYVDVEVNYRDDTYRTRSNYCDKRSIFDGWTNFNRYVENYPKCVEGWIRCPEFRYRKINEAGNICRNQYFVVGSDCIYRMCGRRCNWWFLQ